MKLRNILTTLAVLTTPALFAQSEKSSLPEGKKEAAVVVPGGKINVACTGGLSLQPVLSNSSFTVKSVWEEGVKPWNSIVPRGNGNLKVKSDYWYQMEPRSSKVIFTFADGQEQEVSVFQEGNNSVEFFTGDIKNKVSKATSSSENSESENIYKSIDGDYSSFYHSKWSGGKTEFPVQLVYEFAEASHLDYIKYTPRSGNENGRFGVVTISYNTKDNAKYVELFKDYDFKFSGGTTTIKLENGGVDNVKSVKFEVKTGKNSFVTCAEMEFFSYNEDEKAGFNDVFADPLCTKLKDGVTVADLDALTNPFARQLGYYIMQGDYDTNYRVAEFEPYEDVWVLRARLKTSNPYDRYENPTGIYFHEGDKTVLFVDGIKDNYPVSLIIKDFGGTGGNPETSYPLKNGLNVIKALNKGNSYVSYYSEDFKNAPNIKIHFAMGRVCGYFDLERGDTNEDWVKLLKTTCSDMIDIRTKRNHVVFPTEMFKRYCPDDAVSLALNIDSTIYYERDIMGLSRYGLEPKNHQFARKIWTGGMFADGYGAAAADPSSWMRPRREDFGFWGFGHELGHNNQINPGFKWVGCGETTNNVYSAWVEFNLGVGNYRLETEVTGMDIYSSLKGGRFNSYLEQGVRMGKSWQLQCGPDYGGVPPTTKKTVKLFDYKGNNLGIDTTVIAGNYDHFIKLCPLWQLQLYCEQAGYSPDVYAKVFQDIRTHDYGNLPHGSQQLNFMKLVCDSTGIDFLPFFEKAGMFKPIKAYIEDYSPGWLIIDPVQIEQLKAYVKQKGYTKLNAEVNYITALNWKTYKDQAKVEGTKNRGCRPIVHRGTPYVQVSHKEWKNAVAFETCDKDGKVIRISMLGLGGDKANSYTKVMFPNGSKYINAVGWDGTRMKCYEKN